MEIESLSEIFDDPLLNEFTDNLLEQIDVSEFQYIHTEEPVDTNETVIKPLLKAKGSPEIHNISGHGTLEALLRSQNPSTCVPPAPELRSQLSTTNGTFAVPKPHKKVLQSASCRNSFSILKNDKTLIIPNEDAIQYSKSRLISDYLERCDTFDQVVIPANFNENSLVSDDFCVQVHGSCRDIRCSDANESPTFTIHSNGVQNISTAINTNFSQNKNIKRAPHNAIEKRYRASINGRIDELRKLLVPNPTSDTKLNKSAVLRQAIDRIKELEAKNQRLQSELSTLYSIHSSGHIKPYNGSPDSGICSLDPSSSSSSSYSGHDGSRFTPPSLTILNNAALPSSTFTTNDSGMTVGTETADTYSTAWMVDPIHSNTTLEFPVTYAKPSPHGSTSFSSVSPGRIVDGDAVQNTGSHNTNEVFGKPCGTGGIIHNCQRFKRRAHSIHSGPIKIPKDSNNNHAEYIQAPAQSIVHPGPVFLKNSPTRTPNYQPSAAGGFSSVPHLVQSDRQTLDSTQIDNAVNPIYENGFNGLAARTTLCIAALCLIAIDPVVLSGNRDLIPVSTKGTSSRRLLSALNGLGHVSAPFTAWLAYLMQWFVAVFLCVWACKNRTLKRSRSIKRLETESLQVTWRDANEAMAQALWSTAEQKLSLCLATLDHSIPRTYMLRTNSFGQKSLHYVHTFIDWLSIVAHTSVRMVTRIPSIFWLHWIKPITLKPNSCPAQRNLDMVNLSDVRWRLLELYLLAPKASFISSAVLGESVGLARLFTDCLIEFLDDSSSIILNRKRRAGHPESSDVLLKRGTSLVLVAHKLASVQLTRLSSVVQRLVKIPFRHLLHSTEKPCLWSKLGQNHLLWQLITERPGLDFSHYSVPEHDSDPFTKSARGALQQKLVDRCLQRITADRGSDLACLEESVSSLLDLCSVDEEASISSKPLNGRINQEKVKAQWWAYFIRTLWMNERRSSSEFSSSVHSHALPAPPQSVLQCSQTGLLAEAVWLAYRSAHSQALFANPIYFREVVLTAQKSGLLLCQYMKRISTYFSTESLNRSASVFSDTAIAPFWMLACAQLTADWTLSTLTRALLTSKSPHTMDTVQSPRLIESFNSALWVLRQSSILLGSDRADWVVRKVSYYETIRRLVSGANPVHMRFTLMHACRNTLTRQYSVGRIQCSNTKPRCDTVCSIGRSPSEPRLQALAKSHAPQRLSLINTSPGQ